MEPSVPALTRRSALAVGAIAGAAAVAACSNSGETAAPAGGSSSAAPPSSPGQAESPTASGSAAGATLAQLADVPVGSAVAAKTPDGKPVIIAQPSAGKVAAFSAICTHKGCVVAPAGAQLKCPCHGSTYEAASGNVVKGPAERPLDPYAVRVTGGTIVSA